MKEETSAMKPGNPSAENPEDFDDPAWATIPNPTPGRPHPFSKQELDKFHLRAPFEAKSMLRSLNHTALEHDKPRAERKLV